MSVTNSHPIPFTDSHSNFRYRDHFGILRNSEGGIILEPYPTKTTNELAREFFNSSRGEIASDGPPSGFSFTQSPNPGSSSSQAPSSFSSSAASGIFALFFAGRVLKVHCQNNKRLNAEHGLNPRSLGWFEKIGLRGVKVIEVTINGHPCVKNQVVITDDKGEKHEATVWSATDLKDFPVRILSKEKDDTIIMNFKDIKLARPDAKLFEKPAGYTEYPSKEAMMQAVMMKMMQSGTGTK